MSNKFQDIQFAELASARAVCGDLFSRKFSSSPPPDEWPYHLAAFWLERPGSLRLVSYVHFGRFGDTCLVGGMCTDGTTVRSMPNELKNVIYAEGGIAVSLLKYGFAKFEQQFDAFFGIVGDQRALEVDLAAGFRRTSEQNLVVYTPRPLPEMNLKALQAKVLALDSF